jgi:hypothetical protein
MLGLAGYAEGAGRSAVQPATVQPTPHLTRQVVPVNDTRPRRRQIDTAARPSLPPPSTEPPSAPQISSRRFRHYPPAFF